METARTRGSGLLLGIIIWAVAAACNAHPSHGTSTSTTVPTPPSGLLRPDMFPPIYTPAPGWNSADNDFLVAVHAAFPGPELAFTPDSANTDDQLVALGHSTCRMLAAGRTPDQVTDLLSYTVAARMPRSDVRLFVDTARADLCPGPLG